MKPADFWIDQYQLKTHPEGGYYTETYRSTDYIMQSALPNYFKGDRSYCTGIYFLLKHGQFSAFHRIKSDEMWHFYAGECLNIYLIDPLSKIYSIIKLGSNPDNGEVFQAVVPAGFWFASKPNTLSAYSLVGCTVAPGFDFQDFELANRATLTALFPEHEAVINELTL